jgi:hypothetical protein
MTVAGDAAGKVMRIAFIVAVTILLATLAYLGMFGPNDIRRSEVAAEITVAQSS